MYQIHWFQGALYLRSSLRYVYKTAPNFIYDVVVAMKACLDFRPAYLVNLIT
jgi:hypothetical protein